MAAGTKLDVPITDPATAVARQGMGELGPGGGAVALFQQLRGATDGDDGVGAGCEQAAGADKLAGGGLAEEEVQGNSAALPDRSTKA